MYTEGGAQTKTALVLHGMLGNKGNLRSFSLALARSNPAWRFVAMDHRGHGDSDVQVEPHTLQACADDCIKTLKNLGYLDSLSLIIGHSFGGKVALETTRQLSETGARKGLHTWVLDSVPGPVVEAHHAESVSSVMEQVANVPMPVLTKDDLIADLKGRKLSLGLAQWMTTNLRSHEAGGYTWRFCVKTAKALFSDYKGADYRPFLARVPNGVALHFVMARRNPAWTPQVLESLQGRAGADAGHVTAHWVNSGHWVHIEAAQEVQALIQKHSLDGL